MQSPQLISVSFSILSLARVSPATGAQWLTNGSFEEGTAGWGATAAGSGCAPRSGSGVASIAVNDDPGAQLGQTISGTLSPGIYRFSGYARMGSGDSASLTATARRLNAVGFGRDVLTVGAGYSEWSLDVDLNEPDGLRVGITITSATDTVVCLDDLTLEGPLSSTPPATPSDTPVPTTTIPEATSTPVPDATSTAIPTSTTAAPTATTLPGTTPAAATSTSVPPTSTAVPPTADSRAGPPFRQRRLRGRYRRVADKRR